MSKQSDLVNVAQEVGASGYVNIAGGTMTGTLNLPAGGLTVGTDQLTIDSTGRVNTPYQPIAAVRRITTVPLAPDYDVIYTVADINTGGIYNNTNGRFTAPIAGKYMLSVAMIAQNNNTFGSFQIAKNGTHIDVTAYSGGSTIPYWGTAGSYIVNMAANDYLQVRTPTSYPFVSATDSNNFAVFYLIG